MSSSLLRDSSASSTAELAPQRRRLVDMDAAPCLALLDLIPKVPQELAVLEIRPTNREGRVLLRLACQTWVAELEVSGEAEERVAMPRYVLAELARRGRDAERLVAEELPAGGIGWRTFSMGATVALGAIAVDPLPDDLPLLRPPWPERGPETVPVYLNPAYLRRAVKVAEQLGAGLLELVTISHNVVGAVLLISSSDPDGPQGSIQLAAMAPAEQAPKYERPAIPAAA